MQQNQHEDNDKPQDIQEQHLPTLIVSLLKIFLSSASIFDTNLDIVIGLIIFKNDGICFHMFIYNYVSIFI